LFRQEVVVAVVFACEREVRRRDVSRETMVIVNKSSIRVNAQRRRRDRVGN
jgi:hypothetical protein